MIPLVHKEVVEKYKWLNDKEFGDILAIGNTLPGPIITKMSGYIGYRIGGLSGSFVALFSAILPSIFLMVIMLTTLNAYKDQAWVRGIGFGVTPIVAVMMASLTWNFFRKSYQGLGWAGCLILSAIGICTIGVFNIHPGFIIGGLLIIALLRREPKNQLNKSSIKRKEP